ncbi:MAG: MFS transporter [Anaerolineaceae bacterium]|nr:MFS transporter [Anaerolineaceae bacterium]
MTFESAAGEKPSPLQGIQLYTQLGLFLTVRTIMNSGFRMIYPFLPFIARGLGVREAEVTFGITLRAAVGLFSPIIGSLGDAWGRKRAMLLGLALFIVSMVMVFISPTYFVLIVSMVLTSLSKIMFDTAMYAYLGDRVDYRQRGMAAGIAEFGWSGAFLLGIPLAGFLIQNLGWASPFPCFGLIALGVIVLLWRLVPSETVSKELKRPSLLEGLGIIRKHPVGLAALGMVFLLTTSNEVVNVVYGSWMENSFALEVAALGVASTVIGVAELAGEGFVAGFVDRLGKRRAIAIGVSLYSVSCGLLPLLGNRLEGALVGLFLFSLTFEFSIVACIPLMTEIVPGARATFIAMASATHSLGRMAGSLIGPVLFKSGLGANAGAAMIFTLLALLLLGLFVKEQLVVSN